MITKVISGGQTGADEAGLRAAYTMGFETGGWAPKGWRTEKGPNHKLGSLYGLVEHTSSYYPRRTEANTRDSDGTMVFAYNLDSRGCLLTARYTLKFGRPFFGIDLNRPFKIKEAVSWIQGNEIATLNVAGNREESFPGIEEKTFNLFCEILRNQ